MTSLHDTFSMVLQSIDVALPRFKIVGTYVILNHDHVQELHVLANALELEDTILEGSSSGSLFLRFVRLVFILFFQLRSLYLVIDDVSDQLNVVAHDLKLCNPGIVFFLLCSHRICISHYGNEHVKEDDVDQESGCEEEAIAHGTMSTTTGEGVRMEFSETKLIHVLKGVQGPPIEDVRHDCITIIPIVV